MSGHLFAWDPAAVDVPPYGRPPGQKLTLGASVCVVCRALESFAAVWDTLPDGSPAPCPGPPPFVARDAELPGTPPPEP